MNIYFSKICTSVQEAISLAKIRKRIVYKADGEELFRPVSCDWPAVYDDQGKRWIKFVNPIV